MSNCFALESRYPEKVTPHFFRIWSVSQVPTSWRLTLRATARDSYEGKSLRSRSSSSLKDEALVEVKAWLPAHASLTGMKSAASLLEDRGAFSNAVFTEASLPFLALAVKRSATVSFRASLAPASLKAVVERPRGFWNDGGVFQLVASGDHPSRGEADANVTPFCVSPWKGCFSNSVVIWWTVSLLVSDITWRAGALVVSATHDNAYSLPLTLAKCPGGEKATIDKFYCSLPNFI